ncbi:hypothetical protein PGB28_16375 [Primorskyibacter aestuariivivens]|uniref:hypothetical protein n=1 Tax=Primorskyibacter aestuariivivens TaxID=1888912 RepID=UPI0023015B7E|nr:hypothetical protein [Primorskyibacter aestuariivivens]MDA7430043.1 hypothetical protein [Primorskyibacter aestuariivivens]
MKLAAAVFTCLIASPAVGFECPQHFSKAQAMIDKVSGEMEGMMDMMSPEDMALVHALLDDAKMLLSGAHHNHEKPQGAYDHARSIAKADAALGYASAADMLHFKYMEK